MTRGLDISTYNSEWTPEEEAAGSAIQPTLWSVILRAKDPKDPHRTVALLRLASSYAPALYAFARRTQSSPAQAELDVEGFFDHIRARKVGFGPRVHRERLRTFLYHAFQDYVQVTGTTPPGTFNPTGIDVADMEAWLKHEVDTDGSADRTFRRAWARCILSEACAGLKTELSVRYSPHAADVVLAQISPTGAKPPSPEIGAELDMTPGDALEMMSSARRRLREMILLTIRETVSSPADVEVEFWDLFRSA